ncbi:Lrp/AsnC family transcriptional regulator [Parasphingopyxis algicola]|uniref:Lrp/AsnC family transcriptional regulator n=1 Tax=Parasphingopyxis algicola TaxID=2026624 RepID=UPI0015A199FC|nr:Lrp/AsnC family transcriptional regulator [Parasphingopyxis algicola]QLC23906.1 Lrp/AsnC family transcriptional regulator [Parasphingopyxis algicola]
MDSIDKKILRILQQDASLPVAELSERAGISPTPVWRRIRKLEDDGVIDRRVALLDQEAISLGLTGFVLIRTSDHSDNWLETFNAAVASIPEIVEVHRTSGDVDYVLKVVAPDMKGYDTIYRRMIRNVAMYDVSASFSMEKLKATTELPLDYIS